MILARCLSSFQVNSDTEELRSEEAHRPRIPGTARQLSCQPALPLTRIVVREQNNLNSRGSLFFALRAIGV